MTAAALYSDRRFKPSLTICVYTFTFLYVEKQTMKLMRIFGAVRLKMRLNVTDNIPSAKTHDDDDDDDARVGWHGWWVGMCVFYSNIRVVDRTFQQFCLHNANLAQFVHKNA